MNRALRVDIFCTRVIERPLDQPADTISNHGPDSVLRRGGEPMFCQQQSYTVRQIGK